MDRLTAIYYILQGLGSAIAAVAGLVSAIKGKGQDTTHLDAPLAALQGAHAELVNGVQKTAATASPPVRF